ncbi:MAG: hypothetical protein H8E13_21130, partial [Actinobacteria bacterium]|nr:hypothetical protein [Actinomycetota bacterium]
MHKRFLKYIKDDRKWIYLTVIFILVVMASFFTYYYLKIYPPNFSDEQFNFVSGNTNEYSKPGDQITYIINYKNTGKKAVEDFAIELKIPEHTVFISSNNNEILKNTNGTLAFEVGNVKGNETGAVNFIVEVEKPLDNGTLIKLDGTKFSYKIGKDTLNNNINADLISKVESSPDLSKFKLEAIDENGGVLRLGDIIKYKLVVENTGDMNAAGIEIKSNLSEYVDIIENSITDSGEYKDNYVLWKIDKIEINKPETFSFKATV